MSDAKYLGLTANRLAKIAYDLKAQNAKLRELLVDAVEVADAYYCCCGVKDDLDTIKEEMRELGIEVEQ